MVIQQKTRRRRGSLRKVALLGRGAQRERRDSRPLTIDTSHAASAFSLNATPTEAESMGRDDVLEYKDEDLTPRPSTKRYANPNSIIDFVASSMAAASNPDRDPSGSYTSTDEEDMLQIPNNSGSMRQGLSLPSEAESYFDSLGTTLPRRRSIHQAKSPLSYSGLSASTLPPHDTDWDYADTEWWGWVVLGVTWFVFVIGMGSCFDVWSWAWDVGKTPYAPPELEDDPTLPITGYYPALIILTGIMAWVWVINAWVGMKYFRHAKISGD
ncbi:Fc.00g053630.m01.CDS01 [Cosmosporella sp. VM-42]